MTFDFGGGAVLVLSRKTDEQIVIGGHIRVTVLNVSGNRVRLGIDAPRDVPIRRGEIQPAVTICRAQAESHKRLFQNPVVGEFDTEQQSVF